MWQRHWRLSSVVVVVLAGLMLSLGALAGRKTSEHEMEVSLEQVPDSVKATLQSQGGMIEEVEMETENGRTIYEADVVVNGQKTEMKVGADGSLIGKEAEDENDEELKEK
jgi:hypothetical protein